MVLAVRSDSVSALTTLLKFKNAGEGSSAIALEMALDVAESVYRPTVIAHIPGVCNVISDALSRWHEPGKERRWPEERREAER